MSETRRVSLSTVLSSSISKKLRSIQSTVKGSHSDLLRLWFSRVMTCILQPAPTALQSQSGFAHGKPGITHMIGRVNVL